MDNLTPPSMWDQIVGVFREDRGYMPGDLYNLNSAYEGSEELKVLCINEMHKRSRRRSPQSSLRTEADTHGQRMVKWINATGGTSSAFDVTTKGILH